MHELAQKQRHPPATTNVCRTPERPIRQRGKEHNTTTRKRRDPRRMWNKSSPFGDTYPRTVERAAGTNACVAYGTMPRTCARIWLGLGIPRRRRWEGRGGEGANEHGSNLADPGGPCFNPPSQARPTLHSRSPCSQRYAALVSSNFVEDAAHFALAITAVGVRHAHDEGTEFLGLRKPHNPHRDRQSASMQAHVYRNQLGNILHSILVLGLLKDACYSNAANMRHGSDTTIRRKISQCRCAVARLPATLTPSKAIRCCSLLWCCGDFALLPLAAYLPRGVFHRI